MHRRSSTLLHCDELSLGSLGSRAVDRIEQAPGATSSLVPLCHFRGRGRWDAEFDVASGTPPGSTPQPPSGSGLPAYIDPYTPSLRCGLRCRRLAVNLHRYPDDKRLTEAYCMRSEHGVGALWRQFATRGANTGRRLVTTQHQPPLPAVDGRARRQPLFRKYAAVFVILVSGALVSSGALNCTSRIRKTRPRC